MIGPPGRGTDRPTGLRRYIDQIVGTAGNGADGQIKSETKNPQQTEFPMDIKAWPILLNQSLKKCEQSAEGALIRHMVRKTLIAERAGGAECCEAGRIRQENRGEGCPQFAFDATKMVGEPRLPMDREPIPALPKGALPAALPAGNQTAMASIGRGQQADQQRILAKWSCR